MSQDMQPIIQIINASSTSRSINELPFDISDPDDGLRAKFLDALKFDDLGAHPLSETYGTISPVGGGGLFNRANVQILSGTQIASSKYPNGKEDPSAGSQGGWFSSVDVRSEGLLTEGWIEKHIGQSVSGASPAAATTGGLPSVILIVVTANEDRSGITIGDDASKMAQLARAMMANKRPTIVHVAVLVKSYKSTSGGTGAAERGEKILQQHRDASLQEKVCTDCRLPTNNVAILREGDLEKDEWEERVVTSPYAATAGGAAVPSGERKIMSPNLRNFTSALLRSSASYYSQLAEHAERKLTLWRNRYHTTNASFEVNTLVCILRCGRYAFKSGVFRELEANTGHVSGGSIGSARHYEESYRWVMELHRRVLRWRSNSSSAPMTPGAATSSLNEFNSPKVTESPGGGIGVELSLPTVAEVPPPQGTPGLTSKRSSFSSDNISFYSSLYQQSRFVAGTLNTKLMKGQNTMKDLETTWRRHRISFLGNYDNEVIKGPNWYRIQYFCDQIKQYADTSEALWRKDATIDPRSLNSSYFSAAAPWGIYGELAEVVLRLGREMKEVAEREGWKDPEDDSGSAKRFVGTIASGGSAGGWQCRFEQETKRKHRELALEYTLHALALLKENDSICRSINDTDAPETLSMGMKSTTPNAAVRLHYLAGRLFLSQNEPANALPHLQVAAEKTKKWPSMHLSIQRALLDCEKKCSSAQEDSNASIKLLLEPSSCSMLSQNEIAETQNGGLATGKELVWTDDESGVFRPPIDFAVTFLDSTHATLGDTVLACVSVKSCLSIPIYLESIQLNTTACSFNITNLQHNMNRKMLHSWAKHGITGKHIGPSDAVNVGNGVQLNANGLVYFFSEIKLPPSLIETAHGRTAADLSKFYPKNGKLCNMGFSMAAGNMCKSRFADDSSKISLDGKPVAVPDLAEKDTSFFGGVPLVCHGLTLMLKPSSVSSGSLVKIHVQRKHLLSPLGRTDALQYLMEECNYMAHSWSRPAYHPWYLGPRCLRVLSPRPHMEVINLTDPITGGEAVEGTVNRIVFRLVAADGYDCRDVTLRLRCSSERNTTQHNVDAAAGEFKDAEVDNQSLFVQRSTDVSADASTGERIRLPRGWQPRHDVIRDESHDVSSVVTSLLEAGKSMLLPLDVFRSLEISSDNDVDSNTITTSYEVILAFKEIRRDEGSEMGNQVMVVQRGTLSWIKPCRGDFSIVEGCRTSFPCGVQHESNSTTTSTSTRKETDVVSADGENIRMRFTLKTNGLGGEIAASIQSVVNEAESDPKRKLLYTPDELSSTFLTESKQGATLSTSYCITTLRNTPHSNEHVTMPLGAIIVNWKPTSLALSEELADSATTDEYGMAHGPLCLSDVSPMIFYGPQCIVLNAPFSAKLMKAPSPKVGVPFCVTYQITNRTAKSQTLKYALTDNRASGDNGAEGQLMISGKVQGEVQIAPFEQKTFPFTFMSMTAGRLRCPNFCVSSNRHQSWVINDRMVNDRYFFVMP